MNNEKNSLNRSTADWTGIADVRNGFIYRRNGDIIAVLEVVPTNLSLKSQRELVIYKEALASAWNAEKDGFKIFSIGRNADLEEHINDLMERRQYETSIARKELLDDAINFCNQLASDGEISERLYYIMLTQKSEGNLSKTENKLKDRRKSFISNMNLANINCSICGDEDINKMFLLFTSDYVATQMPSDSDLLDIPIYRADGKG